MGRPSDSRPRSLSGNLLAGAAIRPGDRVLATDDLADVWFTGANPLRVAGDHEGLGRTERRDAVVPDVLGDPR